MVLGMKSKRIKLIRGRKLPSDIEDFFDIQIQILTSGSSNSYCRKQSADWLLNSMKVYILNSKQMKKVIEALISVFGDPLVHFNLVFSASRVLQILVRKINYRSYSRSNVGWLVKKGIIEHLVRILNITPPTDALHELLLNIFSVICGLNKFATERARKSGFLNSLIHHILFCPENKIKLYASTLGLLMFQEDTDFDEHVENPGMMLQAISRILDLENNWITNKMGFIICDRYITSKNLYRINALIEDRFFVDSLFEHLIFPSEESHIQKAVDLLSKMIKFGKDKIAQKLLDYGILNFVHRIVEREKSSTALTVIEELLFSNPIICRAAFEEEIGTKEVVMACYNPDKDIVTSGIKFIVLASNHLTDEQFKEFLLFGAGRALKDAFHQLHPSDLKKPQIDLSLIFRS